jgi:acid phosphatase (class A)
MRLGAMVGAWAVLVLAGCATGPVPPTRLEEVRPGYVAGYLQPGQLPDSVALVPLPPAPGSAAQAQDEEVYRTTRALKGTPRWTQAIRDAELRFPAATAFFACSLGIGISEAATPHLNMLLRRVRMDASRANDKAKDHYKRVRPYLAHNDESCTGEKDHSQSYPSGHASIGWAWALALAEIAPDRANAVLARGVAFGDSRTVCGAHWKSDVDAGRIVGAATIARLHADPVFASQMAFARQEVEAERAAGRKPAHDCAAEAQALATGR